MSFKLILNSTISLSLLLVGCDSEPRPSYGKDPYTSRTPDTVVSETVEEKQKRETTEKEQETLQKEHERVFEIRTKDPNLNWLNIGISTGSSSETIASFVFKTYEECIKFSISEDNTCSPIAALPKSYWDAEKK